jgi:hypothetical protein
MCAISDSDLLGIMTNYSYESIGTQVFCQRHNLKTNPCSIAPTTAHVSIFKAATILGVGKKNLVLVPVDENARMDVKGKSLLFLRLFSININYIVIFSASFYCRFTRHSGRQIVKSNPCHHRGSSHGYNWRECCRSTHRNSWDSRRDENKGKYFYFITIQSIPITKIYLIIYSAAY